MTTPTNDSDEQWLDNALEEITILFKADGSCSLDGKSKAKQAILADVAAKVAETLLSELRHLSEFWGEANDPTLGGRFKFIALQDVDKLIAKYAAPHPKKPKQEDACFVCDPTADEVPSRLCAKHRKKHDWRKTKPAPPQVDEQEDAA